MSKIVAILIFGDSWSARGFSLDIIAVGMARDLPKPNSMYHTGITFWFVPSQPLGLLGASCEASAFRPQIEVVHTESENFLDFQPDSSEELVPTLCVGMLSWTLW